MGARYSRSRGQQQSPQNLIEARAILVMGLLSDCLSPSRSIGYKSKDELTELASMCEVFHADAKGLLKPEWDRARYGVLVQEGAAIYVGEGEHVRTAQANASHCDADVAAAKMLSRARANPAWGLAASHATAARRAVLIMNEFAIVGIWLPVYRFRAQTWAAHMCMVDGRTDDVCALELPFVFRPLLHVIPHSCANHECCLCLCVRALCSVGMGRA